MKNFLLKVSLFLLILSAFNGILWFAANQLYFKHYQNCSLNYSAYLLADSHGLTLKHFTEKHGVYNFSGGSDSYFDMKRKISFLISKTDVKKIYITVDGHTLSQYREKINSLDRSLYFLTPEICNSYYEYFKYRYLQFHVILFQPGTRAVIKHYLLSKLRKLSLKNKERNPEKARAHWGEYSANERIDRAKRRFRRQYPSETISYELRQSLIDIINLCKKYNIELIGIKFPLSSDYIKLLSNKAFDGEKLLKLAGFKVLDYTKIFIENNSYFNNQDHLNDKGCKKFVELLFDNLSKRQ